MTHLGTKQEVLCVGSYPETWIRNPFPAPPIDHQAETQIGSINKRHAGKNGLAVVLWMSHLRNDWQESRSACRAHEDGCRGRHTGYESGMRNGIVPELLRPALGSSSGAVVCRDADAEWKSSVSIRKVRKEGWGTHTQQ